MSKQVTIMTWALHRFTHCSRAAVARSKATRYSADSGSSPGSTSTAERGSGEPVRPGVPAGPRRCLSPFQPPGPPTAPGPGVTWPHWGAGGAGGTHTAPASGPAPASAGPGSRPAPRVAAPASPAPPAASEACARAAAAWHRRTPGPGHSRGRGAWGAVLRHGRRPAPRGSGTPALTRAPAPPSRPGQVHGGASKAGRGQALPLPHRPPPHPCGAQTTGPRGRLWPPGTQAQDECHCHGNAPHPAQFQGTREVAMGPFPWQGLRPSRAAPTFSELWEGCGREGKVKSAGCRSHQEALPPSQHPTATPTSAGPSLGGRRRRCRRSTSSISYTLISKGSFSAPARGGGRSTHCPGRLGLRPRAAASGRGAGISRRRCRPGTDSQALDAQRPAPSPAAALTGRAHRGPILKCSA